MGCPYECSFCIDWNNPYRLLSLERLAADLRFLSTYLPGVLIGFHDPNFGVTFDRVLDTLDTIPPDRRNPYVMESSLSTLRGSRVGRLKASNCVAVAPGVESWTDYSNKAGAGLTTGAAKLETVVEHFRQLHEQIPYLQGNFIFGFDTDQGPEPIDLTKEFMVRAPFVWPAVNIPVPYGGTPLYRQLEGERRILKSMPFSFCYAPYLVITLKNYHPIEYYENLIDLLEHASSGAMLKQRLKCATRPSVGLVHVTRTLSTRVWIQSYRRVLQMLRSDRAFLAFHEGRTTDLPEFYHRMYERMLGPYAELMSRADRTPTFRDSGAPVRTRPPALVAKVTLQ
jgi:hypothetical protein